MSTTPLPPATFTTNPLGPYNDPIWENTVSGAAAVAVAIYESLLLFQGEWWESILAGVPYWQSILGQGATEQQVSLILQGAILGVPYVTGITDLEVTFANRGFGMSANVQTAFGPVPITFNYPQTQPQGIP